MEKYTSEYTEVSDFSDMVTQMKNNLFISYYTLICLAYIIVLLSFRVLQILNLQIINLVLPLSLLVKHSKHAFECIPITSKTWCYLQPLSTEIALKRFVIIPQRSCTEFQFKI